MIDATAAPVNGVRLGPAHRAAALRRMAEDELDVLVIGAGATGSGAALDAASRGLSVGLVDQGDLAGGTSSRSSRLVHGGLRYLEQLRFGLVREALHERELLLTTLAPHLVRGIPFLYPLRHIGWERVYAGSGVALYDLLGGARSLPRHRHLTRSGALRVAPGLNPRSLAGALQYFDGQMDDARLAVGIARTAANRGALVTTGTRVLRLLRDGDRVSGAIVRDEESGADLTVRARVVLACMGVWTNDLTRLAGVHELPFTVNASKGVHLLVGRDAVDSTSGLIVRTERSVLFVIPAGPQWIIGTTDTPWDGDLAEPAVTSSDVDYLLERVNEVLRRPLRRSDVLGAYAGLRPLVDATGGGSDTTKVSREHVVADVLPGLVAIAGGKWTTYRVMARDAIDQAVGSFDEQVPASETAGIVLVGGENLEATRRGVAVVAAQRGLPTGLVRRMVDRYGSAAHEPLDLIARRPELAAPLPGGQGAVEVEVVYACLAEGARRLVDIVDRRLRLNLTVAEPAGLLDRVAALAGPELGWSADRAHTEVTAYRDWLAAFRRAVEELRDEDADAIMRGVAAAV